MIGMVPATTAWNYEQQIKRILSNGAAQRIVVIQSPDDLPGAEYLFQANFAPGKIAGVDVYNVDFETNGIKNHIDFFFSYAKDHLKTSTNDRVYYVPDARTLVDKGDALCDLGQYDEAVEAYEEAIRSDPYFAEAWSSNGNALVELGRYNEGL